MFLDQIKKQASNFLQEKYKRARLLLSDVTQAELLADEVTSNGSSSPDAKSLTKLAEASYEFDNYWRIVDILHRRLYDIDWKQWRQAYNTLVLLEFLLTHGPEEFAEQFVCDADIIQELATFKYIDQKGFNWGLAMQNKSERIMQLLRGGDNLRQARLNALKITNEIQGFGNSMFSPTPSSASSSEMSGASSFGTFSSSSPAWNEFDDQLIKSELPLPRKEFTKLYSEGGIREEKPNPAEGSHHWDCPIEENNTLLEFDDDEQSENDGKRSSGFVSGICSKLIGASPSSKFNGAKIAFRSVSDVEKLSQKKLHRQLSMGY